METMLLMRKVLLLFLVIFVSCANPLYTQDAQIYERIIEYKGLTIEDVITPKIDEYSYYIISDSSARSSAAFKKAILGRIKDYDFLIAEKKLIAVKIANIIVSKDGQRIVSGLYASGTGIVYIRILSKEFDSDDPENDMEQVFCHELGHSFYKLLTPDQIKEWYLLYQERLDEGGLEEALGWRYKQATREHREPFPSPYCLHSCSEYFAECFMFYNTDAARLNLSNFKEKQLLRKHIEEVRKKYGETSSRKEYY